MRMNKDFVAGARGSLPILIGVIPFAMITGVAAVSVGLTAWVINVRFTMYSATLAPYLQKLSTWQKALLAYMLSDQAFGVSMSHFVTAKEEVNHRWYYFGSH